MAYYCRAEESHVSPLKNMTNTKNHIHRSIYHAEFIQRPHNGGEIKIRWCISKVKPTVQTNPSQKRSLAFRQRSSNVSNLKTWAFRFRVDRKRFENGGFYYAINILIVAFLNYFGVRSVNEIKRCVFRVKLPFSNSSGVMWTENMWSVFRVKAAFNVSRVTSSLGRWTKVITH